MKIRNLDKNNSELSCSVGNVQKNYFVKKLKHALYYIKKKLNNLILKKNMLYIIKTLKNGIPYPLLIFQGNLSL